MYIFDYIQYFNSMLLELSLSPMDNILVDFRCFFDFIHLYVCEFYSVTYLFFSFVHFMNIFIIATVFENDGFHLTRISTFEPFPKEIHKMEDLSCKRKFCGFSYSIFYLYIYFFS